MTPAQVAALAHLHRGKTESITVQKAHGLAGYLCITYWLTSGVVQEVILNPEGEIE